MKTLSDLFPPGGNIEVRDFMKDGSLRVGFLAHDLLCRLRSLDPHAEGSGQKSHELIKDYIEAAVNVGKGVIK